MPCHAILIIKVGLDGREKLSKKDRESIYAALDSTTITEGEMPKVKAELKAA